MLLTSSVAMTLEPKEYTATRYQELCRRLGVVQSMGRVGCSLLTG
jgi:transposase InsO family protein